MLSGSAARPTQQAARSPTQVSSCNRSCTVVLPSSKQRPHVGDAVTLLLLEIFQPQLLCLVHNACSNAQHSSVCCQTWQSMHAGQATLQQTPHRDWRRQHAYAFSTLLPKTQPGGAGAHPERSAARAAPPSVPPPADASAFPPCTAPPPPAVQLWGQRRVTGAAALKAQRSAVEARNARAQAEGCGASDCCENAC